jgi:hypothetical protein
MDPDITKPDKECFGSELELRSRRIVMSDGRYMIFFTFDPFEEPISEEAETDV